MFDEYFNVQYKTERDGIVETRVEQKITIQSDGDPIDHDKALAEAIQVSCVDNETSQKHINDICMICQHYRKRLP